MNDSTKELEKIKNEIIEKMKPESKKKKRLQWGSAIVMSVLAILTVVSVVQAVQSASILDKINSGAIKPAAAAGPSALPANLQDLPNMVGGC